MRSEQSRTQDRAGPMAWGDHRDGPSARPAPTGAVILEAVDARQGGAATRRVFRGRLRNLTETTVAVTLQIDLPAPFLPSAQVLMQRLLTLSPGESLRVELGSTVGAEPTADAVRMAVRLRTA